MSTTALARFLAKIDVLSSGCWNWSGALSDDAYGRFKHNGRCVQTHRLAYEHFRGPIPEGMEIDHVCVNSRCCNPMHLEAVPQQVNLARKFYRRQALHAA
jgi:hypothetical protein